MPGMSFEEISQKFGPPSNCRGSDLGFKNCELVYYTGGGANLHDNADFSYSTTYNLYFDANKLQRFESSYDKSQPVPVNAPTARPPDQIGGSSAGQH